MVIGTIATTRYLSKATLLAQSLRAYHPGVRLALCVPEARLPTLRNGNAFDRVILASDLGYEKFGAFAFRHRVIELCTAVKARFMQYLFATYSTEDIVVYLDPDVVCYGRFVEAENALCQADILVTPHHLVEQDPVKLQAVLVRGVFNLGFLGLRRTPTAMSFLAWWDDLLATACYIDPSRGLFVDQKWMDVAVGLFPITVLREPGYNVGYWNAAHRRLAVNGETLEVNGRPLRFLHFSGIDHGRDLRFWLKAAPHADDAAHSLRREYKAQLSTLSDSSETEWSYDRYASGERIVFDARQAVRLHPALLQECCDPFATSNEFFLSRSPVGLWS